MLDHIYKLDVYTKITCTLGNMYLLKVENCGHYSGIWGTMQIIAEMIVPIVVQDQALKHSHMSSTHTAITHTVIQGTRKVRKHFHFFFHHAQLLYSLYRHLKTDGLMAACIFFSFSFKILHAQASCLRVYTHHTRAHTRESRSKASQP